MMPSMVFCYTVEKIFQKEYPLHMNMSTGTPIYRPLDLEHDFIPLVALLNEIKRADHDDEIVSEADLHDMLTWTGQDPATNTWVVTAPNSTSLIGCGLILKAPNDEHADLFIAVHPSWRGQGIGSELFTFLLGRARALNTRTVRGYVDIQHRAADRFVRNRGFEPVSTYTRLTVSASQPFPDAVLPPGFVIRSYDQVQSIDLLTQAMNRSYEGLWGHLQTSEEDQARWLPRLKQEGIFLLFAPDGAVAGVGRAELSEQLTAQRGVPTGHIDAPGVVPEYRGAGLYLPLLLTIIHWLVRQQPAALELESWGDEPGTLALYRTLGFRVMKEEVSYRRDV